MNEQTNKLISETIAELREEAEQKARNSIRSILSSIVQQQQVIAAATKQIVLLKQQLASVTIEPVELGDLG